MQNSEKLTFSLEDPIHGAPGSKTSYTYDIREPTLLVSFACDLKKKKINSISESIESKVKLIFNYIFATHI